MTTANSTNQSLQTRNGSIMAMTNQERLLLRIYRSLSNENKLITRKSMEDAAAKYMQ